MRSKNRGAALFIAILVSMSIGLIAISTMKKVSATTQKAGQDLKSKRLLTHAESASKIVIAQLHEYGARGMGTNRQQDQPVIPDIVARPARSWPFHGLSGRV